MDLKTDRNPDTDCENNAGRSHEEAFAIIRTTLNLLTAAKPGEEQDIHPDIKESPEFAKLITQITDLRILAEGLNRGDLNRLVYSSGYILANLKALQSNLRHLTWQTKKIAEGDFSQRVDFLGDFSESFNSMTQKLEDSSSRLTHLASFDTLTKVANRRHLEDFLDKAFKAIKMTEAPLCILLFDIDHFKKVNDTYGHAAGDRILIGVSGVLNSQFRATDLFARYGGEEFMAVMPGVNIDLAYKAACRAIRAVEASSFDIGEAGSISVTVSCGVSQAIPGDQTWEDISKRSDSALYTAKNSGRNTVRVE